MSKQPKYTSIQLDLFAPRTVMVEPTPQDLESSHDAWVADQVEPVTRTCTIVPADQVETAKRDSICEEWRSCTWAEACMTPENDATGICYREEPQRVANKAFSRDELKVLAAGFGLVKYSREEKMVWLSEADPCNLWTCVGTFPTYAAAERKLKELIAKGNIETGLDGKISMSGWNKPGSLITAGFEFYRTRGGAPYESVCAITVGSRNWSYLAKYPDVPALQAAWVELMQDPKALEG